jgi:DNA-binding MarR family transcriptional regulator
MVRIGIIIRLRRIFSKTHDTSRALLEEFAPLVAGERAAFAHRCHARSISMTQLNLLHLLEQQGATGMSQLAELLDAGLPAATGLVTRMEERGLVERLRDDAADRRVVRVRLTETGERELRELHEGRRRRFAAAIAQLTDDEREQLLGSLRSLRAALERVGHGEGAEGPERPEGPEGPERPEAPRRTGASPA